MTTARVQALIEVADRLPADLAAWLVCGLEAWQRGEDLAGALGLVADLDEYNDGTEWVSLDTRDEWLQIIIPLCPGASTAAQCSFFLSCLAGDVDPRNEVASGLIGRLRRSNVKVPHSIKHLRRILDGRRQDGWRIQGHF